MEILFILLLTALNAIFAMSELALSTARKARLATAAAAGDKGAQVALKLQEDSTSMLSTVQVGITSIGLLNGIIGEAAFATGVSSWLLRWGMPEGVAGPLATFVVVVGLAYITLIFGEMVPKRIGLLFPEAVARYIAIPMDMLAKAVGPFVRFIAWSTHAVLRLLRVNTADTRQVTEAEIAASLDEGLQAGLFEKHERRMVANVFHLDDRPLTSIMLPRAEIIWFEAADTVASVLARIVESLPQEQRVHAWYPVCKGDLDHVLGTVSSAQLLAQGRQSQMPLEDLMLPAIFVPETLTGMDMLEQFRIQAVRMVFVVDEYGALQGLLTPHDLLEAITGELKPELQEDAWALQLPDGSWQLDGLMPLAELKARLDIEQNLPEEDKGYYNTLAGLLMARTGRLLHVGDVLECAGWRFEVQKLEGRRVVQVAASAISAALREGEGASA